MIVLVDGYNLLKHIHGPSKKNLDKEKNQLINRLSLYKKYKSQTISNLVLVFDAGPCGGVTSERVAGIEVVYSGVDSTADLWIVDYVAKNRAKELFVVTQDQKLACECRKFGADILGVLEFNSIIRNIPQSTNNDLNNIGLSQVDILKKYTKIISEDDERINNNFNDQIVDMLMYEAVSSSKINKPDNELHESLRRSKSYTLSKKQKKFEKKVKKL